MNVPYDQLFDFTKSILTAAGCSEHEARISTEVLLRADLRGVDSHGVARLSGYVRLIDKKRVRAKNSEVDRLFASNSKAKKILKWKPEHGGLKGFKKGLEKTINWFDNPKNLKFYNSDIYSI